MSAPKFGYLVAIISVISISEAVAAPAYTVLDPPNLEATSTNPAVAINDSRSIAGTDPSGAYRFNLLTGTKDYLPVSDPSHLSEAYGLSANNIIAGRAGPSNSLAPAVFFASGQVRYPGTLGGSMGLAFAVNSAGHSVGMAHLTNSTVSHAFYDDGTNKVDLGTLGGEYSFAFSINDSNQVVGRADLSNGLQRAFYYSSATGMTNLGAFGGQNSAAAAINNRGQILVIRSDNNGSRSLLVDGTNIVDLGSLGGPGTDLVALNEAGWAVGAAYTTGGVRRAVMFDGARLVDLNTLIPTNTGWELDEAVAINNHQEIIARGRWETEPQHRFVLLVPETSPPLVRIVAPIPNGTFVPRYGDPWGAEMTVHARDLNGHTITNFTVHDGTNRVTATFEPVPGTNDLFFVRLPALDPGPHQIRVTAVDATGAQTETPAYPVHFTAVAPRLLLTPTNGSAFPYLAHVEIRLDATNTAAHRYSGRIMTRPLDMFGPVRTVHAFTNLPTSIVLSNMPGGLHRYRVDLEQDGVFATSEPFEFTVGEPPVVPRGPYIVTWIAGLGGTNTQPRAINQVGDVVGVSQTSNGQFHAFLHRSNQTHALPTLGGTASAAVSINNRGEIVGWALDALGHTNAVRWTNGLLQPLGFVAGEAAEATDINDLGEIVGLANGQGFLWHGGRLRRLGRIPYAINNAGLVVGAGFTVETAAYRNSDQAWPGHEVIGIQADSGRLYAVNEAGTAVGYGFPGRGQEWGHLGLVYETRSEFRNERVGIWSGEIRLWDINQWRQFVGERMRSLYNYDPYNGPIGFINSPPFATVDGRDLNELVSLPAGWSLLSARGINNLGTIVAVAGNSTSRRAVFLNPRPALSIHRVNTSQLELRLDGYPGTSAEVEWSNDLRTWGTFGSGTILSNGAGQRLNPGEPARFFRTVAPRRSASSP